MPPTASDATHNGGGLPPPWLLLLLLPLLLLLLLLLPSVALGWFGTRGGGTSSSRGALGATEQRPALKKSSQSVAV
jgi:hypothetical protein